MKFTRLIVGFLILVVAIFIIAGEQLAGVSSDAVINARVTTIRAPIEGEFTVSSRLLGSRVVRGEELGSIRRSGASTQRLDDLSREQRLAGIEIERIERMIGVIAGLTDASLAGNVDEPNLLADDLRFRMAELGAALEAQQAALAVLDEAVAEERVATNLRGATTIVSNANGLLWDVRAAEGEYVGVGDALLLLVDCDSTIVTVGVTESVYNRLSQGDTAEFRVNNDNRIFSGTISRLAGAGAEVVYANLAIAPSQRQLSRFDVTLHLPELRESDELKCAIGRTGRVFFEARPLDFLRRFWE